MSCRLQGEMNQAYEKEWFISILRMTATGFIVLCHILQFYDHFLAWWFNVGVQIFFLISGYLHADRSQKPMMSFMKGKLFNILPDYYIYGSVVIAGYSMFLPLSASMEEFAKMFLITGSTSLSSLAHFWFMPYILFCYFLTPWFNAYLASLENLRGGTACLIRIVLLVCIVEICCVFQFKGFTPAWINCYLFGMILRKFRIMHGSLHKNIIFSICSIMLILNCIQILIDYFIEMDFEAEFMDVYNEMCRYAHVFLALGVFIFAMQMFSKKDMPSHVKNILNISDRYSYDIFLVHPVLVWSGISPLRHIDSPWAAGIVLIAEILLAACLLNRCASFARKQLRHQKIRIG